MDINQYQQYIISSKVKGINDLKYNYEIYQAEVQRNLSEHLVLVRSGTEKIDKLQNVFVDASKSPFSYENIETKDLNSYTNELSFIKLLLKMEINLLDKTKILQQFLFENFGKDIYILFFSYDPSIITNKALIQFRKMLDNKNVYGPKAMFVAVKYDILQDQSNHIVNETNKISLYRNGTLLVDNYQDGDKVINQSDPQIWSFYQMQQHMISLEQNLGNFGKTIQSQNTEITHLKQNPIPLGFIYVQLGGQPEPVQLWPGTQWQQVTASYAGQFFRAEGAGSSPFGQVQEQQTQSLNAIITRIGEDGLLGKALDMRNDYNAHWLWSGSADGWNIGLKVKLNNEEVRPRNQSVRIWKRVK